MRAVRYGLDLDFYTAGRDYAREVLNRADFSRPTAGIGPLPLGESSSSRAPGALGEHPRVHGTVAAIERELMVDDLVLRYRTEENVDGLPPGEGAFLACTFWLADAYAMMGRYGDAERIFEHLLSIRNDLGLLAEEYDPRARRQLGNFPQGFSHVALINTANNLISRRGPAEQRAERDGAP